MLLENKIPSKPNPAKLSLESLAFTVYIENSGRST
jgi:hypothetical protein